MMFFFIEIEIAAKASSDVRSPPTTVHCRFVMHSAVSCVRGTPIYMPNIYSSYGRYGRDK